MSIKNNFQSVTDTMKKVLNASGRLESEAKLVAVSKTVGPKEIRELYALGQRDFAENRPQILRDKIKELGDLDIKWHFIGHLQSNKIKYVYPFVSLVHSIDRTELLEEFERWAEKTGIKCPCLLEVHISGEEAKQGFEPSEVLDVIKSFRNSGSLDIRGMMGMAPLGADQDQVRKCFRSLHEAFIKSKDLEGPAYRAEHLSMGMSGDYEIALEEGATDIRVGTALWV